MKKSIHAARAVAVIVLESARAQAPAGMIAGVITDSAGKAVQGAKCPSSPQTQEFAGRW